MYAFDRGIKKAVLSDSHKGCPCTALLFRERAFLSPNSKQAAHLITLRKLQ